MSANGAASEVMGMVSLGRVSFPNSCLGTLFNELSQYRLTLAVPPDALDFQIASQHRISVRPRQRSAPRQPNVPIQSSSEGLRGCRPRRCVKCPGTRRRFGRKALVAGPVKGDVVASCRNTSRNDFSCGVRIVISRSPLLCLLVRVCLSDFCQHPVIGILGTGSCGSGITFQRSSPPRRPERLPTRRPCPPGYFALLSSTPTPSPHPKRPRERRGSSTGPEGHRIVTACGIAHGRSSKPGDRKAVAPNHREFP